MRRVYILEWDYGYPRLTMPIDSRLYRVIARTNRLTGYRLFVLESARVGTDTTSLAAVSLKKHR
jgi:hypothetical protein